MKSRTSYVAALLGGLLLAAPLLATGQSLEAGRAAFLPRYAALDAARAEPPFTAEDAEALASYPLTPWLMALRLRNALMGKDPGAAGQVMAFLAEAGEAPHARDLRRSLLKVLAENADWATLVTQYREAQANEESRCLLANARIALNDTPGLATDLAQRWIKADGDLPAACTPAINWLKTQQELTGDLLVQRIRARLLDGDATRARALLPLLQPASARAPLAAWADLLQNRSQGFAALALVQGEAIAPDGLADVFLRHARAQPDQAAAQLPGIIESQQLPQAVADKLTANLALALSWNRDPQALQLFRRVPASVLDDRSHEWRVRAALWGGDWAQAATWLREMPPVLANQQRWRYWTGRSLVASGQRAEGRALLSTLANEFDSFGLFAAWQLGQPYTPNARPAAITPATRAALTQNAALERAHEGYLLGLNSIAALEWRAALNTLPEAAKPALIPEASNWGWYAQAITTATELKVFDDARALFPRPYEDLVIAASAQAGVPEEWVYGVMRRESAFRADAGSSAGALGLLQMLPSTAAITARKNGLPKPSKADLLNPEINVPLGALHLAEVLEKFDGNWLFALCAYNAGPGALKKWYPPRTMDADVWMENIPFNETRAYVQRILMHAAVYQWLATGKPVRADAWLPRIAPRE